MHAASCANKLFTEIYLFTNSISDIKYRKKPSGGSKVVKHLTHDPEIKGLNPALGT
jgi:hypothetical protein